jgi:hypothetical protein
MASLVLAGSGCSLLHWSSLVPSDGGSGSTSDAGLDSASDVFLCPDGAAFCDDFEDAAYTLANWQPPSDAGAWALDGGAFVATSFAGEGVYLQKTFGRFPTATSVRYEFLLKVQHPLSGSVTVNRASFAIDATVPDVGTARSDQASIGVAQQNENPGDDFSATLTLADGGSWPAMPESRTPIGGNSGLAEGAWIHLVMTVDLGSGATTLTSDDGTVDASLSMPPGLLGEPTLTAGIYVAGAGLGAGSAQVAVDNVVVWIK